MSISWICNFYCPRSSFVILRYRWNTYLWIYIYYYNDIVNLLFHLALVFNNVAQFVTDVYDNENDILQCWKEEIFRSILSCGYLTLIAFCVTRRPYVLILTYLKGYKKNVLLNNIYCGNKCVRIHKMSTNTRVYL